MFLHVLAAMHVLASQGCIDAPSSEGMSYKSKQGNDIADNGYQIKSFMCTVIILVRLIVLQKYVD